jgi:hypothetical protein
MKKLTALVPLLLLLSCNPFATTNGTVDEANELYEEGKYDEAAELFEKAKEEIPERAELHYDQGLNLLAKELWEDAEVAFSRSLETAADEMRPMVLANLGLARLQRALPMEDEAKRKELLSAALDVLEKAVSLRPDLEPARHNLELVLLHLFPPCSRRDDRFEPNESTSNAGDLAEIDADELLLCPNNVDHYKTTLNEGDRLTVTVTQYGDGEGVPPLVEVLDQNGAIVAESSSEGEIVTTKATATLAGSYFVKIRADDDEEHPYRLTTEVLPSCESLEDPGEENDTQRSATTLPIRPQPVQGQPDTTAPPTIQLRVCPADADWFQFELKQHESILLQMEYESIDGELAARLVDGQGKEMARVGPPAEDNRKEGEPRSLTLSYLDMPADGRLFLELAGDGGKSEATAKITAVVRPPCPAGDDTFESNDSRTDAADLTPDQPEGQTTMPQAPAAGEEAGEAAGSPPIQHLLRRCPGNDDWFSVEVKKDAPQQVQIGFDHARGDLKLEVYSEDGEEPISTADESTAERPGEGALLQVEEDGRLLLRITGSKAATNFYLMNIKEAKGDGGKNDKQKNDESEDENEDEKEDEKQDEQEKQEQEQQQEEEQQKPIEQMMDQLDQEKRPNLEAERMLRKMPNVQAPGGKVW